jgi:hypothetical protein
MTPLVLFAILVLVPILVAVLLRVNAAILFMSLCVGELLVQNISSDTITIVTSASASASNLSQSTIELCLLLLPVVLTVIFMLHSVHGPKTILNILPALGFGLVTALLVEPLLSAGFQKTLQHSSAWHQVLQGQTLIITLGSLIALLFLWFQHRGNHKEHGHHAKRV